MTTIPKKVTSISFSATDVFFGKAARGFLLTALLLYVTLSPGPPLLGEWESLAFFSMYSPQANSLALEITPWGNVGGQGYLLLDLGRGLVELLNLPFSLEWVRLPSKLAAGATLLFFYNLAKVWFESWPSLLACGLLAVNLNFLLIANELVVVAPSLMVFVLFLFVLARLDASDTGLRWATVGAVWALALTMYGPLRLYTTAILILWMTQAFLNVPIRRSRACTRASFRGLGLLVLVASGLLLIDYAHNVRRLGLGLFFPQQVEAIGFTDSSVSLGLTLQINFTILLESLLTSGGKYHSSFVESTFIQGRFPLLAWPVTLLAFSGLVVAVRQLYVNRRYPVNRYAAMLILLGITVLPLSMSQIFDTSLGLEPSLSNYRLAFSLVPVYLLIALLFSVLWLRGRGLRIATTSISIALCVISIVSAANSHSAFADRLQQGNPFLTGDERLRQWLDGFALVGTGLRNASHIQQHMQYRYFAESAIALNSAQILDPNVIRILYIPVRCIREAPISTSSLGELDTKNFHGIFLALYVADERAGQRTGFVSVPSDEATSNFVMKHSGEFPGRLVQKRGLEIDYADPRLADAAIVEYGSGGDLVIVATTPTELVVAQNILSSKGSAFRVSSLARPEIC